MPKTTVDMSVKILCGLGAGILLLAGCSSTVRTLEYKDGKMTMMEKGSDGVSRLWEMKEVETPEEKNVLRKAGWKYKGQVEVPGSAGKLYLMIRRMNPLNSAAKPAFHPMLITEFGARTTVDGIWRVAVSESSLEFSRLSGPGETDGPISSWSSTISPGGWKAKPGWFVYVASQTNVWSYDGDRELLLDTEVVSGNNTRGSTYSGGYPCAVPDEVFSRLSNQKREEIRTGKQGPRGSG